MRPAFTLVELVIVVLILGIIAAVAAPRVLSSTDDALVSQTMTDVSTIHQAAMLQLAERGRLPNDTYEGDGPGGFAGYLPASLFNRPAPIGGMGFGWMQSYSNLQGIAYIDFYPGAPPLRVLQEIDRQYDDGSLASGVIRIVANRWVVFGVDKT